MFAVAIVLLGVLSGATASVVGFGIGSLLTPLLASQFGIANAVAAVTIPHATATALRCWRLRRDIDWTVLRRFGILSAGGALAGAAAYTQLGPSALTRLLGTLLILTAIAQLSGWSRRWQAHGPIVSVFGLVSGFFGGVAGNQGGLRAAALTAFDLSPRAFVATATATGLMVDVARTPIYLWAASTALVSLLWPIGLATVGVLIGTVLGERLLLGLSREQFARVVAIAVGLLGVWLLASTR